MQEDVLRQLSPSQRRAFELGPDPARSRRDRDDAWPTAPCWWSDAARAQGSSEAVRSMIDAYFTCLAEAFSMWSRMVERWADLVQSMVGGFPGVMAPMSGRLDRPIAGADDLLARLASVPEPERSQLIALLRNLASISQTRPAG
jgi:hypothetical protein